MGEMCSFPGGCYASLGDDNADYAVPDSTEPRNSFARFERDARER